jgi:hypothetical protein
MCHANRRANCKAFRDAQLKTCTELWKVDLSGSTTHTGLTVPTNLSAFNVTLPPDAPEKSGLSMSDKIALGIGLGFGIPTIIIGVGTLVCMRRRKARAFRELENLAKDDTSPQPSPGGEPEVEAGWPLTTAAL